MIETLEDWNDRLACCCGMPECGEPVKECESAGHSTELLWSLRVGIDPPVFYAVRRTDWADGGFTQFTVPRIYNTTIDPDQFPIFTQGFPQTGVATNTQFGVIDPSESRALGFSTIRILFTWLDPFPKGGSIGELCKSSNEHFEPNVGSNLTGSLVFSRFRWRVPVLTYLYYKVTWDVAFFPEDPLEDPIPILTDQTWEWTGPGDPEDLDTYRSGWYELEPPDEPGEVRVVNIRYQCYRETPYGTPPPQVTGEGIDWPAP